MCTHVCVCVCVCVRERARASLLQSRLTVTPWTAARQAPLSMGFSRQEYWSGLPCPPPGDLPHPAIEPRSPARTGGFFTTEPLGNPRRDLDEGESSKKEQCNCSGQRKQPLQRPFGGQEQVSFKNLQKGSWRQGREQTFFSKVTHMKTGRTSILSKYVQLWSLNYLPFFFFFTFLFLFCFWLMRPVDRKQIRKGITISAAFRAVPSP